MAQLQPRVCPPFLVSFGSRDFAHLIAQADEMVALLRSKGVPVQIDVLSECDHFEASVACGADEWTARAAAWMRAMGARARELTEPTGDTT